MKIHLLTPEEAYESLHSGPGGLSNGEAQRRLFEYGPNELQKLRRKPLPLLFLKEFTHFFALILWAAVLLCFFAEWKDPGSGMGTLGWAILGVIFINGLFSFWQEYRAEKAIGALEKLLPDEVDTLRQGVAVRIHARDLVPGDILLLEEGNKVPADCRVVEAFGARANNSTLTGEAVPRGLQAGPNSTSEILRSDNLLWAGTTLVSGRAKALVFATGPKTEFGRIAQLTQSSGPVLSPLQKEIMRVSRFIAFLSLVIGGLFFFIGHLLGLALWQDLLFAVGIIVANVPEGLLPTMTLSLARTAQRMARRNALVRHLPSVEAMGSTTVICTDKTGTLTQNRMEVRWIYAPGELLQVVEKTALSSFGLSHRTFFETALHCQNLKARGVLKKYELLGDPMEIALVQLAREGLPGVMEQPRIDEIPFESDRRRLSTLHQTPAGRRLYTKGAPETLFPLCDRIEKEGRIEPLTPQWREELGKTQDQLAGRGLRVLALAYRPLPADCGRDHWEENLIFVGLAALEDPPRAEVPPAVTKCREAGIKVVMVTGDHPLTARSIASQIGLVPSGNPVVLTGEELRLMSETQMQLALDSPEILFARVSADQKLRIVEAFQKKGEIVAVTGDGVNDAPALKKADIGIAMGLGGTDVTREVADIVLADDNFASIVNAVEEGRAVFENIRKFLAYVLTSNTPELVPYLAFALFKVPLGLTVIQILAVDLGTDMFPALALGAEKPDADTMRRPPRPAREHLMTPGLFGRAALFLGLWEALASMAVFFWVLAKGGWTWGETLDPHSLPYLQATSACLAAIVVGQVVNVFMCRHDRKSFFKYGLGGNPLLLAGVGLEILIILSIVYAPWGNRIFQTAPFPAETWLLMVFLAGLMVVWEEGRKWWVRNRAKSESLFQK